MQGIDYLTSISGPHVRRRVATIPLPFPLKMEFSDLVGKWAKCSGFAWTVDRIKALRDYILNTCSDRSVPVPMWFKTTRSGRLCGIPGKLLRVAMNSASNLKAVMFLLNMYTIFTKKKVTAEDCEEIVSTIRTAPVEIGKIRRKIYPALASLKLLGKTRVPKPTPLFQVLPGKKSHQAQIPWDLEQIFKSSYVLDHRELLEAAVGYNVHIEHDYHYDPVVDIAMESGGLPLIKYHGYPDMSYHTGFIHITREPGMKLRYFAAPNTVIQRALEPMKAALAGIVSDLPWDCTHNQRQADQYIQSFLDSGKKVHSVDLSKATDNFPWEFQKIVLKGLTYYGSKWNKKWTSLQVQLLEHVVERGVWTLQSSPDTFHTGIQWGKGQPLGLGPSFFLFTLSHGLLLYILNGNRWDKKFFVLGDDVVILDDELHEKYRKILKLWEVPTSELKSFSSSKVAQFAGVTYVPSVHFWTPKWRPFETASILDAAAWWYPGLTTGLKDDELIRKILSLPQPYGVGRNPNGLSLDERLSPRLVEAIVDRDWRRKMTAKPSNTYINASRLTIEIGNDIDQDYLLSIVSSLEESPGNLDPVSLPNRKTKVVDKYLLQLMDGTEVPGYPSSRLGWCDPYSLGPLKAWKSLYRTVDAMG